MQVDWRIPAGGDAEAVAALRRTFGPHAEHDRPGQRRGFPAARHAALPILVDVPTAGDVVPVLAADRSCCTADPASTSAVSRDPLRRSMRAAICAEGWAETPAAADRLLVDGTVRLEPANVHGVVVPMATVDRADAHRCGWWSSPTPASAPTRRSIRDRATSRGLGATPPAPSTDWCCCGRRAAPVLAAAVRAHGPLDVMSLAAQAVAMGDDVHVRTQAATNLLLRNLLPHLVAGEHPRRVEVATFLAGNHLLFLTLAMASARALTTWAAQVENSSIVTGMSRNGTRLRGLACRARRGVAPSAVADGRAGSLPTRSQRV